MTVPMTDAEAATLRSQVPDDPIELPPGHLPCEGCGVAVNATDVVSTGVPSTPTSRVASPIPFSRCAACQDVRVIADAYVEAHTALAARIGPEIAVERIESVLFGLAIIGQEAGGDLGLFLARLHPAAHGVWFSNPLKLTSGLCSPYPWAHVTTGQRAELRRAYATALRDRLALSEPPVAIRCPTGGCMVCGVASVSRSAIEVAQCGGPLAAAQRVWSPLVVPPVALGSNGPDLVWGHVCPDCGRAIEERGGVGWPARAQALVSYVARTSVKKAERLRALAEADFPPMLPAWRAIPNVRPNAQPWEHLRRVIDRL